MIFGLSRLKKTIYRQDCDENEVKQLKNTGKNSYIKLWREFNCEAKPDKWVVWPFSKSKGWCDKITGKL